MSETKKAKDVKTNQPELEERLSRLNREIEALEEAAYQIRDALERAGAPAVPQDPQAEEGRPEPSTYLERLDDALDGVVRLREAYQDHAARCGYLV